MTNATRLFYLACALLASNAHAATDTFTSSGAWIAPSGVASVTVETWGGGAGEPSGAANQCPDCEIAH